MDWNFYSKRRNTSLAAFLKDASTLEAALKLFDEKEIVPPLEELEKYFASKDVPVSHPNVEHVETEIPLDVSEETQPKVDSELSLKKKTSKSVSKLSPDASEG